MNYLLFYIVRHFEEKSKCLKKSLQYFWVAYCSVARPLSRILATSEHRHTDIPEANRLIQWTDFTKPIILRLI